MPLLIIALKSIGEKAHASISDPYDPELDAEIPKHWPKADLAADGQLKDPVKEAFSLISGLAFPGIQAQDFAMTSSTLRLQLLRKTASSPLLSRDQFNQSSLSQGSFVGSFPHQNPALGKALLTPLHGRPDATFDFNWRRL